jgi:hypothetical protein
MSADINENYRFPSYNLEQGENDQPFFPHSNFTFPCSQLVFHLPAALMSFKVNSYNLNRLFLLFKNLNVNRSQYVYFCVVVMKSTVHSLYRK